MTGKIYHRQAAVSDYMLLLLLKVHARPLSVLFCVLFLNPYFQGLLFKFSLDLSLCLPALYLL